MSKQNKLFYFLTKTGTDTLLDHRIAVKESNIQPNPNYSNRYSANYYYNL